MSTVAGLMPLAYGLGGAAPYMGPMALALGWGLLFAPPLVLPVFDWRGHREYIKAGKSGLIRFVT